jgi:uncharacterized integral membrane protein
MKNAGLFILSVCTIAIAAVGLLNWAAAPFNLLGLALQVPSGALLIAGYVLGFVCTLGLFFSRMAVHTASSQRLSEWQHQDEKLLQQVQTDREKQLEAKIQTLESALQRALKKSSP